MSNEASPYRKLGLSNIEAVQAARRVEDADFGAYSVEYFRNNPKQRDVFIEAGLSEEVATHYRTENIPQQRLRDQLRAAVLAEPNGAYEARYQKLPRDEKRSELYKQIESSAEMTIRLERYVTENSQLLNKPDKERYEELLRVAFGTTDLDTIRRDYPLSQRRGFRLAIVNFIEAQHELESYRVEARQNPKAFVERYLIKQCTNPVRVEELPAGFVVYLGEQDYAQVDTDDGDPASITTDGIVCISPSLGVLSGRIAFINTGGVVSGHLDTRSVVETRDHEVRHILFKEFHEQQVYPEPSYDASTFRGEEDFFNHSQSVREWYVERAKDEMIAYFSDGNTNVGYQAFGFDVYEKRITQLSDALDCRRDMSEKQKQRIYDRFMRDRRRCVEDIARLRIVAERMFDHAPQKQPWYAGLLGRVGLKHSTENKNTLAEVLLRNIPGTKAYRLARYAGLHSEDVKNGNVAREQERWLSEQLRMLQSVPEEPNAAWWDETENILNTVMKRMTPAVLPALIETTLCTPYRLETGQLINKLLLLIQRYIALFGVDQSDRHALLRAMDRVIGKCPETQEYDEVGNRAFETLVQIDEHQFSSS